MADPQYRIRLFKNHWLEKLTVISVPAFIAVWTTCLAFVVWMAWQAAVPSPVLILVGVLLWTLAEYALHRHVFHWKPLSAAMQGAVFIMHGNHHAVPNDPLRNLMPPIVGLPVGASIWFGTVTLLGPAGNWLFLGFAGGYVTYDLVHYACHQWTMNGRLGRALKLHHMRHHHLKESGNYAITGMVWDRVFGTLKTGTTQG